MTETRGSRPRLRRDQVGVVRRRALQFGDEATYIRALELLLELGNRGPIEFQPLGDKDILLPQWSFKRLLLHLKRNKIAFEELGVTSISEFPPEEQARLRGLIWRRSTKP